jgi:hypothetical protein
MEPMGWKAYGIWRRGLARAHGRRMNTVPGSAEWDDLPPAEREAWAAVQASLENGDEEEGR